MKKVFLSVGIILIVVLLIGVSTIAEEITLTTYYPAPYGEYQQLYVSGNVGIGTANPGAMLTVGRNDSPNYTTTINGNMITIDDGPSFSPVHINSFWNHLFVYPENGNIFLGIDESGNQKGNVGIGTAGPGGKLDIVDSRGVDDHPVRLTNNGNANFMQSYLATAPNISTGRHVSGYTVGQAFSPRNAAYLAFYYAGSGSTSNYLSLGLHSVDDALVIQATGNVGIGTTSPGAKLEVRGGWQDLLRLSRNIFGTDYVWNFRVGMLDYNARLHIQSQGTDVLSLIANGNVGIGTAAPGATLDVGAGKTTLADAWTPRSSIRWKENIQPISNALDKVTQLRGVYFDWKQTKKRDLGLIAEEVGKVIPELVTYEENGVDARGLDYDRLVAVLVEAVKEQQKRIEQLEARLVALERRK